MEFHLKTDITSFLRNYCTQSALRKHADCASTAANMNLVGLLL